MKRSHSHISEGEHDEPNKRIKVAETSSDTVQWFEVDDLLGLFIKLVFSNAKLILTLAAASKA